MPHLQHFIIFLLLRFRSDHADKLRFMMRIILTSVIHVCGQRKDRNLCRGRALLYDRNGP
ncbi:hypothetical protein BS78_K217900 [Paspalum vaginatum]|uniref:Uncharacterized protein n=1 Tax=Paspalum vaginatum TaxID=158149 RepID=A0A9W7XBV7_9POAL|nr:hypothetical protein BS78_K217900 [Paspalum vaginatum]